MNRIRGKALHDEPRDAATGSRGNRGQDRRRTNRIPIQFRKSKRGTQGLFREPAG